MEKLKPYNLGQTGKREALPYLIKYLKNGSVSQRKIAASAVKKLLKTFHEETEKMVPYLIENLSNKDEGLREYILKVIIDLPLSGDFKDALNDIIKNDVSQKNINIAKEILEKEYKNENPETISKQETDLVNFTPSADINSTTKESQLKSMFHQKIASGSIKNRHQLIETIKELGLTINRDGQNYLGLRIPGKNHSFRIQHHFDIVDSKKQDHLISIPALARIIGIGSSILYKQFEEHDLICREKNNKWVLTDSGKEMGGDYKKPPKGDTKFVAWPITLAEPKVLKEFWATSLDKRKSWVNVFDKKTKSLISTTALAKKTQIQRKILFKYLESAGWIYKSKNRHWRLTKSGEENGGSYRKSSSGDGKYIVWPASLSASEKLNGLWKNVEKENDTSLNVLHSNELEGLISTSVLARELNVNNKKLFKIFEDSGLVFKDEKNHWCLTQPGMEIGGTYKKTAQGYAKYVVWPAELLGSSTLDSLLKNKGPHEDFSPKLDNTTPPSSANLQDAYPDPSLTPETKFFKKNESLSEKMFDPFDQKIDDIAVVYAHCGQKKDNENTIYSIAAAIYSKGERKQEYYSNLKYSYFSARDRFYSNLSKEVLSLAPPFKKVRTEIQKFLKNQKIILFFDTYDKAENIIELCGINQFIDLNFAAEFFFPHIGACSPKTVWELINKKEREKVSFQTKEVVDLSINFIQYICDTILNDKKSPHAPSIRYFLEQSRTLFGTTFVHIAKEYQEYFGGLFGVCSKHNSPNWKEHLPKASFLKKNDEDNDKILYQSISKDQIQDLYEGMSKSGKNFKLRNEQVEFACHIVDSLNDSAVLTIEAGTGTGKTQGYLVPSMEFLYRNKDARIAISTYTKSLQEQIFQRELPFTKSIFKQYNDIPVALLKGKTSYICAENLDNLWDENLTGWRLLTLIYFLIILFDFRRSDLDSIGDSIKHYLNQDNFVFKTLYEISAKDGCGPKHKRCPSQVVTAEASKSRLIVTNHHKLCHLENEEAISGLFRNYIIDEANLFESAVRNSFGKEIESKEIVAITEYLHKTLKKAVKEAAGEDIGTIQTTISKILDLNHSIDEMRTALLPLNPMGDLGQSYELQFDNPAFKKGHIDTLLISFENLTNKIHNLLDLFDDENKCRQLKIVSRTAQRIRRSAIQLKDISEDFSAVAKNIKLQNQITAYQIFKKNWLLSSHSVDVADLINTNFYNRKDSIIFTAATICHNNTFDCFKKITGQNLKVVTKEDTDNLKAFRFKKVASPFTKDQMEILVHERAVSGNYGNKQSWIEAVIDILPELIRKNKGRTLVLFSSYTDLQQITLFIGGVIEDEGYPLLIQKQGISTKNLCDEFRAIKESVLFGVDTFWYGVDFKGDTLTQVIITRIPYKHQSSPIQLARKRTMSAKDYFERYYFDKEIKLKQGIGRLIRSDTDKGKVIFLDSRYKKKTLYRKCPPSDTVAPISFVDQSNSPTTSNQPSEINIITPSQESTCKEIVCLANSHKFNGCCVAGKELGQDGRSKWIRPVSSRPMGELVIKPPTGSNDLFPNVLDVVAIPILKHFPHYYQTENYLIDENKRWEKKDTIKPEDLEKYHDDIDTLWTNGFNTFAGYNDQIPLGVAFSECTSSLLLIRPEKLKISVGKENDKKRVRARFYFNGVHYSLVVTDQLYKAKYIDQDEGEYDLGMDNLSLCISISEPLKDCCYKLVAGIIGELI